MTPNTDALLSLQPQSQSLITRGGIWRFCSHIMEIPTAHRAVLILYGGAHTRTPIIFHSPCLFLFFSGLFFVQLSYIQFLFRVWIWSLDSFLFLSFSLLFHIWSFYLMQHRNFWVFTSTWHLFPSYSLNAIFLVHTSNYFFSICPLMDTEGTEGHRETHKGPLTFSRWLRLCLICPCHPRWQNTKAQSYKGHHFTPSPQLWPQSINSHIFCF